MNHVTWLDWYAEDAARRLAAASGSARHDDASALWIMCVATLAELSRSNQGRDALDDQTLAQYVFFGAVASIAAPTGPALDAWRDLIDSRQAHGFNEILRGGKGLKLSPRLLQTFAHAKAPDTDDWRPLAHAHGWYLDLPHHGLRLGSHQVRAILTHPDSLGGVSAVAVLTKPGSDEITGRYAWMLIGHQELPTGSAVDEFSLSREELQAKANDFIALSLLYYQSLETVPLVPRLGGSGKGKSKIERRLERRTRSIFAIHALPDPAGNLGRPVEPTSAPGTGWALDHRVQVRGHFRWQPHGKGREQRRLIWIEAHVRGADLPDKPELIQLREKK